MDGDTELSPLGRMARDGILYGYGSITFIEALGSFKRDMAAHIALVSGGRAEPRRARTALGSGVVMVSRGEK